MVTTPTATQETTVCADPRDVGDAAGVETPRARGHIGRIVAGSLIGGFVGAVALVVGPFAGAQEHVITGSVLLVFAAAWGALAVLSQRWTDQPQRWATVPAGFMAVAGGAVLALAPTGNELGWVWPPVVVAVAVWMGVRARHDLRSRTRVWLLYPICAALVLSALGGAYETYRETTETFSMPGRLIDVGGHKLHIDCTGTGSPTVVLEPGLGEPSTAMAWIAPAVATTTRVCVYDRAGRGWSESASGPQDGVEVATDLHTLLERAGERGPFVLAGHSAGGIYVLNFAHRYPEQVAGVALLDSMHPEQYTKIASWPAFYEMFRRVSAVLPSLSRLGIGRAIYASAYSGLPAPARDAERAFLATPRDSRSTRDEFSELRTAMTEAQSLTTLGNRPLVVVTAEKDAAGGWMAAQNQLAALSTNSVHQRLPHATHSMLTEDKDTAARSSRAINEVVNAARSRTAATSAPRTTTAVPPSLLPEPTGNLAVGVRTISSGSPAATTRVWYPARNGTGTGVPMYLADKTAAAHGLPAKPLHGVVPRASVNAEPARATHARPAVVLMPGWGNPMALSTALAQDLASNGYIVVAVDPTLGTEDGSRLPADTANPARRLDQVTAALNFVTGPDIAAVAGPVDPNKVAVGGHSIAGAIAFQTSLADARVHAVFDLDGWLHGPALATPVTVPALMIDASGLDSGSKAVIGRTATAVTVKLAGATHLDVTDLPSLVPALGPIAPIFGLGTIGRAGTTTTNAVVLRFLDVVLRDGKQTPSAASLTGGLAGVQDARAR